MARIGSFLFWGFAISLCIVVLLIWATSCMFLFQDHHPVLGFTLMFLGMGVIIATAAFIENTCK